MSGAYLSELDRDSPEPNRQVAEVLELNQAFSLASQEVLLAIRSLASPPDSQDGCPNRTRHKIRIGAVWLNTDIVKRSNIAGLQFGHCSTRSSLSRLSSKAY